MHNSLVLCTVCRGKGWLCAWLEKKKVMSLCLTVRRFVLSLDLHFVFSVDLCFVLFVDFIFLVSPTDL